MRYALLVLLASCIPAQLVEQRAEAAQTLTGTRPYLWAHILVGSQTDWDLITVPSWVRQCMFVNEHASGTLYIGDPAESGTFDGTNDEYGGPFEPGVAVTIPIGEGSQVHSVIPLASATASLPVSVYCTASPE